MRSKGHRYPGDPKRRRQCAERWRIIDFQISVVGGNEQIAMKGARHDAVHRQGHVLRLVRR
jgi:hypothetical protein